VRTAVSYHFSGTFCVRVNGLNPSPNTSWLGLITVEAIEEGDSSIRDSVRLLTCQLQGSLVQILSQTKTCQPQGIQL